MLFKMAERGRLFLSTSPLRGTTDYICDTTINIKISIHVPLAGDDHRFQNLLQSIGYFYPRPPCGGRQIAHRHTIARRRISIHVPLAGDDRCRHPPTYSRQGISIHVPLAGDDVTHGHNLTSLSSFLSTSPLRGTTGCFSKWQKGGGYFYPRPPCGGRRYTLAGWSPLMPISIHVPLAGDDNLRLLHCRKSPISIHVPLAGDDCTVRER